MNIKDSIYTRKTTKILSPTPLLTSNFNAALINELLTAAHWAPFHKPCADNHRNGGLDAIMPWRFYILGSESCRKLNEKLKPLDKPLGKIEGLLNSADYLIQATWTPDTENASDDALFHGSLANMEHIAAASAAIQNILLTATAKGIANYWSSGGVLRDKFVFDTLGIDKAQILLASIFLFSTNNHPNCEQQYSKMRDKRSAISQYSKQVIL